MPVQNIIKLLKKGRRHARVKRVVARGPGRGDSNGYYFLCMYSIRNSTENREYEDSVQKIAAETFRPFADQRGGKARLTGKTVGIHNKYFLNLLIEMYRCTEP